MKVFYLSDLSLNWPRTTGTDFYMLMSSGNGEISTDKFSYNDFYILFERLTDQSFPFNDFYILFETFKLWLSPWHCSLKEHASANIVRLYNNKCMQYTAYCSVALQVGIFGVISRKLYRDYMKYVIEILLVILIMYTIYSYYEDQVSIKTKHLKLQHHRLGLKLPHHRLGSCNMSFWSW